MLSKITINHIIHKYNGTYNIKTCCWTLTLLVHQGENAARGDQRGARGHFPPVRGSATTFLQSAETNCHGYGQNAPSCDSLSALMVRVFYTKVKGIQHNLIVITCRFTSFHLYFSPFKWVE